MEDKRDWQADIELAHRARYEYKIEHLNPVLDALFYWLQYAEKWHVPYKVTCKLLEIQQERADKAEAREQKLKEAMEAAQYYLMRESYLPAEDAIEGALVSLYPKETTE